MYNYFMLIGRLGKVNNNSVILNVAKPFKNEEGVFEVETFEIQLDNMLMSIATENFEEGDWFNIKGRLSKDNNNNVVLIGERIIVERE